MELLERPPKRLWDRLLAEPDRAPEYIALAAAERFGPQAEDWVRIAGPGHTPARQPAIRALDYGAVDRWSQARLAHAPCTGQHPRPTVPADPST